MKKTMFVCMLLAALLALSSCSVISHKPFDASLFCGVAEPLTTRVAKSEISVERAVAAVKSVGAKTVRLWFENYNSYRAVYEELVSELDENGINIIGMHHNFSYNGTWLAVPEINSADYEPWLNKNIKDVFAELAKLFPQVKYWEVGNETNMSTYLHKAGYYENGASFLLAERVQITADIMRFAYAGVKGENPKALVLTPGFAPEGGITSIKNFLAQIYEYIGGDSTGFFDAVAYHPYYDEFGDINKWIKENNSVYAVMKENGDADKPVFFTEFGFSDSGDYISAMSADKMQARNMVKFLDAALASLSYVDCFCWFRLLDDPSAEIWGGVREHYFGVLSFKDGIIEKKAKGEKLAEIYGKITARTGRT